MFVSKSSFDQVVGNLQDECRALRQRHWELQEAHWRLMKELGYEEQKVEAHTLLVKKGGPEQG